MDINYELYKVFYHVAKTLSFSEAASELFISQSAVSQSIKTLEKRLDQTLFRRSTKQVRLTKEGELLFKHIEPAIHLIRLGEHQILESRSFSGGQLRIAASDTICRYYLVPCLNEFHKRYPNVHIRVTSDTSLGCVDLLAAGQADLIIINSPNSRLQSLPASHPIHEFHDVFIADKSAFPELLAGSVSLRRLTSYPILMLDKRSTTSEFLHQLFRSEQLELAPAIELSSNDLLIDLARIGLGIAFVPEFCVNRQDIPKPTSDPGGEASGSNLFVIQTETALPPRRLVAAYPDPATLSAPAGQFLSLLGISLPSLPAASNK